MPTEQSTPSQATSADVARAAGVSRATVSFVLNDTPGARISAAFGDRGVAVPQDVAVVGADDLLLGQVVRPRLTSIRYHLPSADLPAEAVDRLVHDGRAPELPRVWFEVVPRQSS